jgi:hypothetical protein
MKKLIFILLTAILYGQNIYLVNFQNCNTSKKINFYMQGNNFYLKNFLRDKKNNVYVLFKKGDFFHQKNINRLILFPIKNNLINLKRMLANLANKKNLNNSLLIIFNPFEFNDKNIKINTCNKKLNAGWINSSNSPYVCNIFNVLNNNSLKGLKVAIIDFNSENIDYLQNRKCFYYNFFKKLGAYLAYYGNPHSNISLIFDSFKKNTSPVCEVYFNNIDSVLLIDDETVNFNFCSY